MKTSQDVITGFFRCVLGVISKNSSKNYGIIIFADIKKKLVGDFPLLNQVEFIGSSVTIRKGTKNINPKEMVDLFNKIIETLGPDILKLSIKQQMDAEDIIYLKKLGVKLNGF